MVQTVVVSGASGLLGRAIYQTFKNNGVDTIGLAYSRANGDLVKLDLTNQSQVQEFFDKTKPSFFIHSAAEKHEDIAEKNKSYADKINVEVPEFLATQCAKHNCELIYICTNWVFDGANPPYRIDATPNPLNHYGLTKLQGERAIHRVHPRSVSIRVPVLYGDVEHPGESAITNLMKFVKNQDQQRVIDHHSTRFPTHVQDIARSIYQMTEIINNSQSKFPNIVHISNTKSYTFYEICQIFGKMLGVTIDHLQPQLEASKNPAIKEAENCELCVDQTLDLGIDPCTINVEEWFKKHLETSAHIY